MPTGGESLVTLAGAPAAGVLAHPLGTLTVTQRVAPLDLRLDHVDGAPVTPGTVVRLGPVTVGPSGASTAPATEPFPRARFQELSDEDRLTKPTFERLPAGARITPQGQTNPAGTVREFEFEPVTIAPLDVPPAPPSGPIVFPVGHLGWHVTTSFAAASPLRAGDRLGARATAQRVEVTAAPLAVVDAATLSTAVALTRRGGGRPGAGRAARRCRPPASSRRSRSDA